MDKKELFERNKENLKLMLSNKNFILSDYSTISTFQYIEYSKKYKNYTMTIVLHTNNTLNLKICNDKTKNLLISKRLILKDESEQCFMVTICDLFDFIIKFNNLFID